MAISGILAGLFGDIFMKNKAIEEHFTALKSDKRFDAEFVELLTNSYIQNEIGEQTAKKAMELISKRYDKNKENKA